MSTPAINPINTTVPPAASKPAESVWTKEINPNIPTGHAESDSYNNQSEQDPAALNIKPEIKQLADASVAKTKQLLMAAGAAIVAAIAVAKRKSLPVLGKIFEEASPITTSEKLKKYAEYAVRNIDPPVKKIKIHKDVLESGETMSDVIKNVRKIAEDLITSSGNKGKRPVVHVILNPEHADKADQIINQLNSGSTLNIADGVVQKVEMFMEPVNKTYEKLLGNHPALINVGPPRFIDRKVNIFDLLVNSINNWSIRSIPK